MAERILVTGAGGQLGLSLRKIAGEYPSFGFVFADSGELDITDSAAVDAFLTECGAAVVINCAAYTAVDKAETDADAAAAVNTAAVMGLAMAAASHDAALVHISTDYVFDGTAARPYAEDAEPCPMGVYGRTKAEGEREMMRSGCRGAIVRTAWLYSEFGHNFVRTMLSLSSVRDTVSVVCDQTGSPTYATDLARAVMTLVEGGFCGPARIYHFTGEGCCTWSEFAERIFGISGAHCRVLPITSQQYGAPAPRPSYSVLATDRIRAAGVKLRPWRESLEECVKIIERQK